MTGALSFTLIRLYLCMSANFFKDFYACLCWLILYLVLKHYQCELSPLFRHVICPLPVCWDRGMQVPMDTFSLVSWKFCRSFRTKLSLDLFSYTTKLSLDLFSWNWKVMPKFVWVMESWKWHGVEQSLFPCCMELIMIS